MHYISGQKNIMQDLLTYKFGGGLLGVALLWITSPPEWLIGISVWARIAASILSVAWFVILFYLKYGRKNVKKDRTRKD